MANRVLYFVCATTGRVFRTSNVEAASPTYEDLGIVDAGGLYCIALDEFDKTDGAMVCGPNGVWSTTNLSAATPTWTLEITAPANWDFHVVRSSPIQDQVWMVSGSYPRIGDVDIGVWWTTDDGNSWGSDQTIGNGHTGSKGWTYLEMSSHSASTAWLTWLRNDGVPYIARTTDTWSSHNSYNLPACMNFAVGTEPYKLCTHHRYTNNASDLVAVWGGIYMVSPTDYSRVQYCTNDVATCTCVNLCSGTHTANMDTREVGCYRLHTSRWWALAKCGATYHFFNSDNGTSWTDVHTFTGTIYHAANWPDDVDEFIATHNGTAYPLLLSTNRGDTWTAKNGNWNALGYNGDIRWVAVGIAAGGVSYAYDITGGGLPDQAINVDGNGNILYMGLYNASNNPVLLTVGLPLDGPTSSATSRYAPGAGDSINVKAHYLVGDFSIIAGHFGNNEQARRSEDAGVTYSDIDPNTWAANNAQPIAIDPNDEEHVLLALDTNDDLVEKDSTDTWTTLDASLPFDVGAMAIYDLDPNEIVIARINAGTPMVEYSPNNGSSWGDISGALPVTDGIASIELV